MDWFLEFYQNVQNSFFFSRTPPDGFFRLVQKEFFTSVSKNTCFKNFYSRLQIYYKLAGYSYNFTKTVLHSRHFSKKFTSRYILPYFTSGHFALVMNSSKVFFCLALSWVNDDKLQKWGEVLSSASDKEKLFPKNFFKNSNLDDSGIPLPVFPSRPNLKLHNIHATPTLVKNVITNLGICQMHVVQMVFLWWF